MRVSKLTQCAALVLGLALNGMAAAYDDRSMYSLEEALNTLDAKAKLDPSIKLYFGQQKHPKVEKSLGAWKASKKSNGLKKPDQGRCDRMFLSAVLDLQARARKEGGDAVVDIASNYENIETSSDIEYMCGNGNFISVVALKGRVVKLSK